MFKLNLRRFGCRKTFKYGFSHMPFQIWEPVYAAFRLLQLDLPIFDLPMKSAAAATMTKG
jgi:hypothetical protein